MNRIECLLQELKLSEDLVKETLDMLALCKNPHSMLSDWQMTLQGNGHEMKKHHLV